MSITSGGCPIARAAMIIGTRWTAMILSELLNHGARRFQDFQNAIDGIAPTTLSSRLKMLEDAGVLERKLYDTHPPRAEYVLTEKGKTMRPVIRAMADWGERYR